VGLRFTARSMNSTRSSLRVAAMSAPPARAAGTVPEYTLRLQSREGTAVIG
jgi:hypothetical protein